MDKILDHRYRLLGTIGEGGASTVYRAVDLESGELRAVKVLDQARDASASLPRLQREARVLLSLRHPNILSLHGFHLGETPYLVMELCNGTTLRTVLERKGPVGLHDALCIGSAMLAALQHAHANGVIHRDVKPGNILLGPDGAPLLADFGIAVLAEDLSRTTLEGLPLGTFAFMAPEQRLCARSVDARADLYALGATLYELATGRSAHDLFMAQPASERWEGLPLAIVEVLRKACAYRPEDRYPTAAAMRVALEAAHRSLWCVPCEPLTDAAHAP